MTIRPIIDTVGPRHHDENVLNLLWGKNDYFIVPTFILFFIQFVPFLMETVRVLPMIAFPILYFLDGDEKWVTIGVFSYFGVLLLFSVIAIFPTGAAKPGLLEKITR